MGTADRIKHEVVMVSLSYFVFVVATLAPIVDLWTSFAYIIET